MIQVIYGSKGSGKTKRLLDMTNEALKAEKGDVVFVDDDKRYMYDLKHEIRFVDISEYAGVKGSAPLALLSFLGGMLSVNYDIAFVAVDAFMKIVRADPASAEMKNFFDQLAILSENHHCDFVVSMNVEEENIPDYIKALSV